LLSRPKKASETGNFELWNSTNAVDAPQIIGAWADEALATSSLDIFSAFGLQIPVEMICRPLRDSLQYTRLLALFRTQNRQIRCCLDEVPLFDLPDYTAFSYCWGSLDDTGLFLSTIKVSTSDKISERLHYLKNFTSMGGGFMYQPMGITGKGDTKCNS
jgi:hypothetical protein